MIMFKTNMDTDIERQARRNTSAQRKTADLRSSIFSVALQLCLAVSLFTASGHNVVLAQDGSLSADRVVTDEATARASEAVALAVRGEVQSLYSEIKALRQTVAGLKTELNDLRAELKAQRNTKAEQGYVKRKWQDLKKTLGH